MEKLRNKIGMFSVNQLNQYHVFLEEEVPSDDVFEAFGRVPELLYDGILQGAVSDDVGIAVVQLLTLWRAHEMLIARLIEVHLV